MIVVAASSDSCSSKKDKQFSTLSLRRKFSNSALTLRWIQRLVVLFDMIRAEAQGERSCEE